MPWIDRRTPHKCNMPYSDIDRGQVQVGSKWQCDDPNCGKIYKVAEHQIDGFYFQEVSKSDDPYR